MLLMLIGVGHQINADQVFRRVYRWHEALPEFDVGHLRRLQARDGAPPETAGLVFAGDYLGGPFVEGALRSGVQAAHRLTKHLPMNREEIRVDR